MQQWKSTGALLLAVALTACGGDGDSSSATQLTSTQTWDLPAISTKTQFLEYSGLELASRDAHNEVASHAFLAYVDNGMGFASDQSDLVANDTNGFTDIFQHSTTGMRRLSVPDSISDPDNALNIQANGNSGLLSSFPGQNNLSRHTISSTKDGRYVAFVSNATNLAGPDTNDVEDVYVRFQGYYHRPTSSWSSLPRTYRASLAADGTEPIHPSFSPALVEIDHSVVFVTASALVAADTNDTYDIYRKNLETGNVTLISRPGPGMVSNGASFDPQVAGSGEYIFFLSWASNLDSNDTNHALDLFIYNTRSNTLKRMPMTGADNQGDNGLLGSSYTGQISLPSRLYHVSYGGRYVAFLSESTNLVANDLNGRLDAFVRDIPKGLTTRISTSAAGSISGASLNGIAIAAGSGTSVLVGSEYFDDSHPAVFFTSDQPYFSSRTGGNGIDIYGRNFYGDKVYRISNSLTDSWPIANVDYLQGVSLSNYEVVFSGSASTIGGGTVNGLFRGQVIPD